MHTLCIGLAKLLGTFLPIPTPDIGQAMSLLLGDPKAPGQAEVIKSVGERWVAISGYFVFSSVFAFLLGKCANRLIKKNRRANWYELLTKQDADFIWLTVDVELGGEAYLYAGMVKDFRLSTDERLERVVLLGAVRRTLKRPTEEEIEAQAESYNERGWIDIPGEHVVINTLDSKTVNVDYWYLESDQGFEDCEAISKLRDGVMQDEKQDVDEEEAPDAEFLAQRRAALDAYRQSLIEAEKKGQDSFDKTVLSLAGGALGISFLFIKDVIGENPINHPVLLLLAWLCWAASTLAVLSSFFTSNLALRRAVQQCDNGTIDCEPPGGFYSKLTRMFNVSGIVFLISGILFMAAFVYQNLLDRDTSHGKQTHATVTSEPATAPDPGTNSPAQSTRQPDPWQGVRTAAAASNEEAVKK